MNCAEENRGKSASHHRIFFPEDARFLSEESIGKLHDLIVISTQTTFTVSFNFPEGGTLYRGSLVPTAIPVVKSVKKILGNLSDQAKLEIGVANPDKDEMFVSGLYIPADVVQRKKMLAVNRLNAKLPKGEKLPMPEENEAAYFTAEQLNAMIQALAAEKGTSSDRSR